MNTEFNPTDDLIEEISDSLPFSDVEKRRRCTGGRSCPKAEIR